MAAVWGYAERLRILCTREFQVSIPESFHAELRNAIERYPWLSAHYTIGRDFIRGANGTEFLFRGLRHNSQAIKSLANIDLTIVEEAETVPEESWLNLEATVFRRPKSELIAIWNPALDGSPVDQRFIKNPPKDAYVVEVGWEDNPFFPDGLDTLRRREQERLDPQTYSHIWEGAYLQNSDAQVLHGKYRVAEFTPQKKWDGPYFGADWGFSQDPTTLVRFWLRPDGALCIEHEAYGAGVDLDDTPDMFDTIPGARDYVIRADAARPETVSHMRRRGFRCESAPKWSGSVEDGVAWLRGRPEIVIHPRCKHAIREARLWSYKVDRHTGDVLPKLADGNEHIWDAVRYGAAPMIKNRGAGMAALTQW